MSYTWEDLHGPKPTKEQRVPITVGCTVTYSDPNLWDARYRFEVTQVQGRRVWVQRPDGSIGEEHDANLRVVLADGTICVNTTEHTDWEQHYDAARQQFERSQQ